MEPLYFGQPEHALFGLRFEPRETPRDTAVLICSSWGMEYMRSYRALSLLADSLAAGGYETMRFDYSCTGDSAGYSGAARLATWIKDIRTAAHELRELSGASRLCLLGVRLGGLLALAALRERLDADQLVLWDAPESGRVWIDEMKQLDGVAYARKNAVRTTRHWLQPAPDELLGMPFPQLLNDDLASLSRLTGVYSRPCLNLCSADQRPPYGAAADSVQLPDPAYWSDPDWITTPWSPAASLKAVTELLRGRLS